MQFYIDDQFISSVTIRKEWGMYDHIPKNELTHEQFIKVLKGEDRCTSVHSEDHPEFTKLRNELERLGYISTCRQSWNGDRVLKPFKVNEWKFKHGEKFCCSAAMRVSIDSARKHGRKTISI